MSVAISLTGKNALVTGGGAGMGKCTAMMLAEAGANVFVADIKEELAKEVAEEIAKTYGVKTGYCKCDVSKKAEVENMVAGYDLDIKVFNDYVLPNKALDEKDLDANFMQHAPYLLEFNKANGTNIKSAFDVHLEPMGAYSKKFKNTNEIKDGAKISQARARSDRLWQSP